MGNIDFLGNITVPLNQWSHAVLTYSNSTGEAKMYLNGTLTYAVDNITDAIGDISSTLSVGYVPGYLFNGTLDEVMIWNKSLSASEVSELYNNHSSRFFDSGEILFQNLDVSGDGLVNISFEDCQTLKGSYLQGKVNNRDWINFTGCYFNDSDFSGDLTDVDITVKLISNPNNFYSSILEGSFKHTANASNFAQEINLTYPPENYSDSYYGAESNPTGNPIGGFVNYSRIVNSSNATYYVNTKEEFLYALSDVLPGEIIYINDSVTLDFSGDDEIIISTNNITIASGRGNNYSQGALLRKDVKQFTGAGTYEYFFKIYSSNVRFTGLRFDGGSPFCDKEFHNAVYYQGRIELADAYTDIYRPSKGVYSDASFVEVDNSEFFGWRGSAVEAGENGTNNYFHHNYIHNTCHHGLGYGAASAYGNNITVLIEANLFDKNRHSIASTYDPTSYEARYNIQMSNSGSHSFDRHGNEDYTSGGNYTIIHHNTFYTETGTFVYKAIGIRSPPNAENGGQIYNNWFQDTNISTAIFTVNSSGERPANPDDSENVTIFQNLFNLTNLQFNDTIVIANASNYEVSINETVSFDASGSYKNSGTIRYIEWDFADNSSLVYGEKVNHSFSEPGRYKVKIKVSDSTGFFNLSYLNITVNPENGSKAYLNFWVFENSLVDSNEYVKKVAIVDNRTIWEQNFTDNRTAWTHVNVEIPLDLISDNKANVTLGVETIKNYTDPLYPSTHEVEFFEVYFDAVAILSGENESVGSEGDFEGDVGDWTKRDDTGDAFVSTWTDDVSWERRINGNYAYRIAPIYRDNYTNGTFVGISQSFFVTEPLPSVSSDNTSQNNEQNNNGNPGGSSSRTTTVSRENLEKGYSQIIKENHKIKFKFDNQEKTLETKKVESEKVIFQIDEKDYEVSKNETKKIDLDNDGFYDLEISVEEIDNQNFAKLDLKLIHEEIPAEQEKSQGQNIIEKISLKTYILIGTVIVLIIIWIVLKRKK